MLALGIVSLEADGFQVEIAENSNYLNESHIVNYCLVFSRVGACIHCSFSKDFPTLSLRALELLNICLPVDRSNKFVRQINFKISEATA